MKNVQGWWENYEDEDNGWCNEWGSMKGNVEL